MTIKERPPVFGTFGIYRYLLASMVVMTHLGPDRLSRMGGYAVFAFYILSGYVVSYILLQHYLYLEGGLRKYTINRLLRIFPLYWIALILSLPLLLRWPTAATDIHPLYQLPQTLQDWVWNIIALGMTDPLTGAFNNTAIISVSWSLGIELIYWMLLPKYVQQPAARKYFLYFSLGYTGFATAVTITIHHFAQPLQFTNAPAAALPFATGLFLYLRNEQGKPFVKLPGLVTLLLFALMLACAPHFHDDPYAAGLLLAYAANAMIIAQLSRIDSRTLPSWLQALDRQLGNLCYPLYLVHVPIGLLIHVTLPSLSIHTMEFWAIGLSISSVAALMLHCAVEIPLDRIRERYKS